jgi:hypothetical protein
LYFSTSVTVLFIAILANVKLYLTVILIHISLVNNIVESNLLNFLAICISSLEKCLFRFFAHFNWVIFFLLFSFFYISSL